MLSLGGKLLVETLSCCRWPHDIDVGTEDCHSLFLVIAIVHCHACSSSEVLIQYTVVYCNKLLHYEKTAVLWINLYCKLHNNPATYEMPVGHSTSSQLHSASGPELQ
jgi:hypothetical protein